MIATGYMQRLSTGIAYPARHLRWKIILPFVILSTVLGLAGTYLTTHLVSGSLAERFDNQLAETARSTSDAFVRRERKQLEVLRTVSFTDGVAAATRAGNAGQIERFVLPVAVNSGVERVEVLDAQGQLLFGARVSDSQSPRYEAIAPGEPYTRWAPVQNVLAGVSDAAGDKFAGVFNTTRRPVLYTVGPLALEGRPVGAVLIGTPLASVLAAAKLEALGDITIYDADGSALASTFALDEPGQDERLRPSPSALAGVDSNAAPREAKSVSGRDYDLLFGTLSFRGGGALPYSVALPSSFIAGASIVTRTQMTLLFVTGTAAVLVIGWLLARALTTPILRLVRTAEAVSAGDLSARSGLVTRDEIGTLARAFDSMTGHLQRQHISTIKALSSAIDARDPYTMGHSMRVGQLSMALGGEIWLDRLQLQHLEIGRYLHDIGKIGVRDSVLLKPGSLSDSERLLVEEHPLIGLRIIDPIELPQAVREIVGGHHEKLDGSGYPYQLSGEELSIFSRIASVADIYDALTTARPYRPPLLSDMALELLDREAVKGRIDREVVNALAVVVEAWEWRVQHDEALRSFQPFSLVEAA